MLYFISVGRSQEQRSLITTLEVPQVRLDHRTQAHVLDIRVPQHLKFLTRHQNLYHDDNIDEPLRENDKPDESLEPFVGSSELQQICAECNSSDCRAHDTHRLADEMPFHRLLAFLRGETLLLSS
jgi:hypothetical protein